MRRPTSVTVFGVLNIAFGTLGLMGSFLGAIGTAVSQAFDAPQSGLAQALQSNAAYRAWNTVAFPLNLLVSGTLLAAGIGLLMMRPWARHASIACGVYRLIACVVGALLGYFVVLPEVTRLVAAQNSAAAGLARTVVTVVLLGASLLCFVYPALLVFFMTRRKVADAFRPPGYQRV